MPETIAIQFSRFSALYSPLIATILGGFLEDEGLRADHKVATPDKSPIKALIEGSAHVVQSAVSQGFAACERGEANAVRHFAQINEKDGFFLLARGAEADDGAFTWESLRRGRVLADHAGQPLAMFQYACKQRGLDFAALDAPAAGSPAEMEAAFRAGEGDFIHLQGPAPQQLETEGLGRVVASVGEAIPTCAFSSLAATPDWLQGDMAGAFTRAYRKARRWLIETPAAEVAALEQPLFPDVDAAALARTIGFYQGLGCWTPHIEITPEAFEVSIDVFLSAGRITKRHPYDAIVASPPA